MDVNEEIHFRQVSSGQTYPYHLQTTFSHIICCVVPCVSPFTPYGLAPFTGIGDGSMDLALVPKCSRCANMSFMRKVAMHGPKSVLSLNNRLTVFRVSRWSFTPASLLQERKANDSSDYEDGLGAWNLDGGIV